MRMMGKQAIRVGLKGMEGFRVGMVGTRVKMRGIGVRMPGI